MSHLQVLRRLTATALVVAVAGAPARAQDVAAELRELQVALAALRTELAQARRDADDLRKEVQVLREQVGAGRTEAQELLTAKVEDLEQTKVESGSKYHLRLSGMALLHATFVQGEVDSTDLPGIARGTVPGLRSGSIAGGARQSYLRLDVFGPRVGDARFNGEVTLDFFGGFPITPEGTTTGLARLRTASLSLDWSNGRISAGHQSPFFSPVSPTSLVSSAYPPLWAAGNMWSWVPQVFAERSRSFGEGDRALVVQAGVLDPLTGELPGSEYERVPTAGERSGRPAIAGRAAWQQGDDPSSRVTIGAGGYYSRQVWGFDRTVNAWAATADWTVPLRPGLSVSGEWYRGRAISGLGASASPSVAFVGARNDEASLVLPFRSTGGWAQVKVSPLSTLEFNAAIGTDRSAPAGLVDLVSRGVIDPATVRRNSHGLVNGIYRLRSNLLLSLEYRRLSTTTADGTPHSAGHLSVGGGLGF